MTYAYALVTETGSTFAVIPAESLDTYFEMTRLANWQKIGPCYVSVGTGDSLVPFMVTEA